jgi:hypothetical protein
MTRSEGLGPEVKRRILMVNRLSNANDVAPHGLIATFICRVRTLYQLATATLTTSEPKR